MRWSFLVVFALAGCASERFEWERPTEPEDGVAVEGVAWRDVPVLDANRPGTLPYLLPDGEAGGPARRTVSLPEGWSEVELQVAAAALVDGPDHGAIARSLNVRGDLVEVTGPAPRVDVLARFVSDRARASGRRYELVGRVLEVREPAQALPRFTGIEILRDGAAAVVLPPGVRWPQRGSGERIDGFRLQASDGSLVRFEEGERLPLQRSLYSSEEVRRGELGPGPLDGVRGAIRAALGSGPDPVGVVALDVVVQSGFVHDVWVEEDPPASWEERRPASAVLVTHPAANGEDPVRWLEPVRPGPTQRLPVFGADRTAFAGRFALRPGETLCLMRPTDVGVMRVLLLRWKDGRSKAEG